MLNKKFVFLLIIVILLTVACYNPEEILEHQPNWTANFINRSKEILPLV
jgi:hypothetical protein